MNYRDGISILCLREPRHSSTKWLAPNPTAGDSRDFLLDCAVPESIHPVIVLNSPSVDGTGGRRSTQLTSPLHSWKSLALFRLLIASITVENVCWGLCWLSGGDVSWPGVYSQSPKRGHCGQRLPAQGDKIFLETVKICYVSQIHRNKLFTSYMLRYYPHNKVSSIIFQKVDDDLIFRSWPLWSWDVSYKPGSLIIVVSQQVFVIVWLPDEAALDPSCLWISIRCCLCWRNPRTSLCNTSAVPLTCLPAPAHSSVSSVEL